MAMTWRPGTDDYLPAFADYVGELREDEDVLGVLGEQLEDTVARLGSRFVTRGDYRYAPGKWTVKDVVGHLSDTERVFACRALWIARGEATAQPGFDDQSWVARTGAERRTLAEMVEEWGHVRHSTLSLFRGLAPDAWGRRGTAGDGPITVRALPYVIAGHTRHHLRVLEARYLG